MFTPKELSVIKLEYFNVIFCASDVCEVESKNGDHWMIMKVQIRNSKRRKAHTSSFSYYYQLYHRHADISSFHLHAEHIDLLDAVLDIIAHDDYRLGKKGKTYFDDVVEMYG